MLMTSSLMCATLHLGRKKSTGKEPYRVWAIGWQGGKRRLRTSSCPCWGRLGKNAFLIMAQVPDSGSRFRSQTTVSSLYSCYIAECDVKLQQSKLNLIQLDISNLTRNPPIRLQSIVIQDGRPGL